MQKCCLEIQVYWARPAEKCLVRQTGKTAIHSLCDILAYIYAYTQDEENDVFKRDFGQATLEDHFDKTVLPKVMQVKDFGRAGRTKYTHLVDQDTTEV